MSRNYHVNSRQSIDVIGDLCNMSDKDLSSVGKTVKLILTGDRNSQPQDTVAHYNSCPAKGTPECVKDTCCIWKHIADEMKDAMTGTAGRCNALARGAIRLGFHDAGTYSKKLKAGGADGSIVTFGECEMRSINKGLEEICHQTRVWFDKYKEYGISMADLIQMGANVATVVCPLGPRVRSFVGRKDATHESPVDTMPIHTWSADQLISLFEDKTISAQGLVALVGAHTTSQQRYAYPDRALSPQDSSPGVWDVLFYGETMNPNAPSRILKFPSDVHLSEDSRSKNVFAFYADQRWGHALWNEGYAREYVRLSLLGVNNINSLTDCTKALPGWSGSSWTNPDQKYMDEYMQGKGNRDYASSPLRYGDKIPDY